MHTRIKQIIYTLVLASVCGAAWAVGGRGQYQWSVGLRGYVSAETGKEPQAFLWLPEGVDTVRAVIVAQQNMTEEQLFRSPTFKREMSRLGVGMVWIAPWLSQTWDPASGCQSVFDEMLTALAYQSGHEEIATRTAVIPFGHSAQATFPWNFAAWNNARTLCTISFHGDAPRTNLCGYGTANVEWGRTRNIDGIPGLMIEGEYEWWEARVRPALAFRMMYPESCVSFLCDTGHGHFDLSPETAMYIALFIEKSLIARQPRFSKPLVRVDPRTGWLCERWHMGATPRAVTAPWAEYRGDRHDAFWYFDREMALATEARYARDAAKHCRETPIRVQMARGETYASSNEPLRITPSASDMKDGTLRLKAEGSHIEVVCGPLEKCAGRDKKGFETFRRVAYECGSDNPKRSFTAWLVAVCDGDSTYKDAVRPIEIKLPR